MKEYLKHNFQFIFLMISWILVGKFLGPAIYVWVALSVVLMQAKGMHAELLISFFFMLILSDSRQPGLHFAESVKNMHILLLALFFVFDLRNYDSLNRTFVRFLPFFLIALVCLFFSEDIFVSFQKTLSYFLVLLIVTNLSYKLINDAPEEFLSKLIYFGLILLLYGFFLRFAYPMFVTLENRYTGVLGNPNGLGVFTFLFFIIYSIVVNIYPGIFSRTERLLILTCVIISIFLCGSRSAIFSVLLFILFSYFYRLSSFLGIIMFIAILLVYQYVSLNLANIVTYLGMEEYFRIDTLEDGSGRLIAWNFAWENIQSNMFIGKGFYYTEYLYKKYYEFLSTQGHQGNAHNSYLTIWLDTGLIGLFLYLSAFIITFVRAAKTTHLAIPVLYSILFSANFESWLSGSLNPLTIQVWIIITLLVFLKPVEENEENGEIEAVT